MLVSIIIPVYNSAHYVADCLTDVYCGDIDDELFEVIVIDDCSTDETTQIIDSFSEKHSNLTLIRQKCNHRQGAARNIGLNCAKGKWVVFLDSDDLLLWHGVMSAVHTSEKLDCDVCYFDFEWECEDGSIQRYSIKNYCKSDQLSSIDYLEKFYSPFYNASWRTIYRTDFVRSQKIEFVEDVRWEDCDWTVKIYMAADNIGFVDEVGYRYVYNKNATSKQIGSDAVAERLFAGYRLIFLASSIIGHFPNLSNVLFDEGKNNYIRNGLRLRNMTKYSLKEVKHIYSRMDSLFNRQLLSQKISVSKWVDLMLRNRKISIFFLSLIRPITVVGRYSLKVYRIIRLK